MIYPRILFEDNSLYILDKPSGMVVNNSDSAKGEETVQDWLQKNFQKTNINKQLNSPKSGADMGQNEKKEYSIDEEFISRGGIVHRLDKEQNI